LAPSRSVTHPGSPWPDICCEQPKTENAITSRLMMDKRFIVIASCARMILPQSRFDIRLVRAEIY